MFGHTLRRYWSIARFLRGVHGHRQHMSIDVAKKERELAIAVSSRFRSYT